MKWLFNILFLIAVFVCNNICAQTDTAFHLIKSINTNIAEVAVDNLDNIYILSGTDLLKKFNANGDSIGVYNDVKTYGKLYSVDVTNPLKVLLLYKDFSTIVVLDRLLAVRNTIDLRRYNILQVSAVGLAYDNNIWLYDMYDNKLKKIDDEGNILLETPDFRQLFNESVTPQQIIDQNGFVYLYDSAKGLLIFDYYGTFKKKIPITNWKHVKVINHLVFGISNHMLNIYNTATYQQYQRKLPSDFNSYSRYIFSSKKLYTASDNLLNIYTYQY